MPTTTITRLRQQIDALQRRGPDMDWCVYKAQLRDLEATYTKALRAAWDAFQRDSQRPGSS